MYLSIALRAIAFLVLLGTLIAAYRSFPIPGWILIGIVVVGAGGITLVGLQAAKTCLAVLNPAPLHVLDLLRRDDV